MNRMSSIIRFIGGMRRAWSLRLAAIWTFGLILPTLIAALPCWRVLAGALDRSPRAGELARHFDMVTFADLSVVFRGAAPALGGAAFVATLVAVLLQPLLAGVTLTAYRAKDATTSPPLSLRALVAGGVTLYDRMFRMALVALIPLGAALAIGAGAFTLADKRAEHAVLESQATTAVRLAWVLAALAFVVAHATVELGRAQLAVDERGRSAMRAWLYGVRVLGRRPVAVIGRYLGATVLGLCAAAPFLLIRLRLVAASATTSLMAFLLLQIGVAAIGWARAGRLFALADVLAQKPGQELENGPLATGGSVVR
jgi:hypothetical protein